MIHFNKINCIIFMLVHLSYFAVIEGFYEIVHVTIKNGDEIIELNWKRTEQYLANKNLPIWFAEKNKEPRLMPQIMEKMTGFITYHDVEKSSAAVYVAQCNCFYGIIDTRFYIFELPLNCLEPNIRYEVGDKYVVSRKQDGNGKRFHDGHDEWLQHFFTADQIKYVNSLIDSEGSVPHSEPPPLSLCPAQRDYNIDRAVTEVVGVRPPPSKILYPEILVFITHDIYTIFTKPVTEYMMNLLVLYYITYFNAIDMLFAKLASDDIAVRINIAGLVIETEHRVFPHRFRQCTLPNHRRIFYCDSSYTFIYDYPKYITRYSNIFVEDSFDFFFISTRHVLREDDGIIHGKSSPLIDVWGQRTFDGLDKNMLGSIVQYEGAQGDYVIAAHHIAQLMNIKPDEPSKEGVVGDNRCHMIMQRGGTHCRNCLKWTQANRDELRTYARVNLNHCFLLNYPRSLHPYGQPVLSINPEDQCMCYKYPRDSLNPFYIMSVPADSCDRRMQCSYREYSRALPLPLDGTPCGGADKVCWRRKCMKRI